MPTYVEIMAQIEALQKQAEAVRQQEIGAVIADIREKIQAYHLTAADLGLVTSSPIEPEKPVRSKRSEVKPKYLDPATGSTWSGRGVMPKWLKAEIDAGRSKEAFLIPDSEASTL